MSTRIADDLSHFATGLRFESLPEEVVEKSRLLLLDTLGCAFAASATDFAESASKAVGGWRGAGECSVVGHAKKFPAADAALLNGILAHGLDYDDTHPGSVVHASSALVPAVLAMAEQEGRGGRDALAALAVGAEAAIRIALPARHGFHLRGFHTTAVTGPFGAALASAMLRGMTAGTARDALGIVGSIGFGLMECIPAGAGAKRLHSGLAASAGIKATDFAAAGFTGPGSIFEGRLGLYNSLLRNEPLDLEPVCRDLGRHWELMDLCPKLYPCCGHLLSFLDGALDLRTRHGIRPEQIESIEVRTSVAASNVVCEPWDKKLAVADGYEARFSLPFAVALMFVRGHATLADFADDACRDPAIVQLMPRVRHTIDPDFVAADMPAWIEVSMKDGSRHISSIPFNRGDRRNPLSRAELFTKFRANTAHLGTQKAERIGEMVMELEQLKRLDDLMAEIRG